MRQLTVIANAPNPAGQAIVGRYFRRRFLAARPGGRGRAADALVTSVALRSTEELDDRRFEVVHRVGDLDRA